MSDTNLHTSRKVDAPVDAEPAVRVAADDARDTVVVVHGLWMPGWETLLLRRRLEAAGYATVQFAYPTIRCGLDENVDRLAAFVAEVPGRRIHFVGHSLGGVLVLKLFERAPLVRAGRVVCLGSPLTGTHAGRVLESWPLGRRIAGRCIHDLIECGGCEAWSGATELGIIAGDVPLGGGRLLGGLEKPHDGTVSVSETRLPGATEHIVLHCTHMSMLWSPVVAKHVVHFLRDGRFAHS
ncbi:MAG TPA: alpha/beta hydrolase [Gammaproteobacteria bacterium]